MTTSGRDELVRLKDAAIELGVTPETVKKYCRCEMLRCRQLPSGHWRVYRSSLDAANGHQETYGNLGK